MTFTLHNLSVKSPTPGLLNKVLSEADRRGMCQSGNRPCCVLICQRGDAGGGGTVGPRQGTFPAAVKRP